MSDLQSRLTTALGGTYRIDRELGGGGMSRVFLAEEVALARQVVIKVLPPEMAAGVNQERFRREIQLAARLQHPHIVPLLSAGSSGDLLWYAMPFLEGESLRVRLAKQGELPIRETLQMLREIADALSYAHEHGVVHRDIKPDNVLISGRHVMVTDFGVAKAVSESTGGSSLTSLGVALGTPAYMAPEQAAADPNVDHRADIYALGAMGYEMLTGRPPFTGMNPQAVLAAHVMQAPPPLAELRPAVPAALNALIMRCLEKRAADRWQHAEELFPNLEALLTPSGGTAPTAAVAAVTPVVTTAAGPAHPVRVAALFAAAAAAVLGGVWVLVRWIGLPDWVFLAAIGLLLVGLPIVLWGARNKRLRGAILGGVLAFIALALGAGGFMALRAAGVGPFATLVSSGVLKERDKLVVADFENRSADSTLGQSVTEALRIDLARSPVVQLLETADVTAALARMEKNPETTLTAAVAREVAERGGAKAVVTGEIAPLGAGFVLSARVIAPDDGRTLLAERETADNAGGLIAAVDKLSRKLREGLGESLRSIRAGARLENVTTTSLEALREYSQAEAAADFARYDQAVPLLRDALKRDSTFAMAWRKLGVVLGNQLIDRAGQIEAVTKAYQLRDRLPERERLLATAFYHGRIRTDIDAEMAAYSQVLERWPDDRTALNNLSIDYAVKRRFADAERMARRGLEGSPNTGVLWFNLIDALVNQGKFVAADSAHHESGLKAPLIRNRYQMGYRIAFGQGDYAKAMGWADSLGQSDQVGFQALSHGQKANVLTITGHLAGAARETQAAMAINRHRGSVEGYFFNVTTLFEQDVWFRDRPESARRRMDSVLAGSPIDSLPVANRPYLTLAAFYARAGDPDRAERYYQTWERSLPQDVRDGDNQRHVAQGFIALARGRATDAVTAFRKARDAEGCTVCWLYGVGEAFEELHQPDSALAAYEGLATLPEPGAGYDRVYGLPPALRRLGELYEAKGNKAKAVEYYSRLLDLWRDADAEVQPRVAKVKQRVAELVGEPKH